jgi:integrase/recombinase XerC
LRSVGWVQDFGMLPALPSPTVERFPAVAVPSDDDLVEDFLRSQTVQTARAYDGDLRDFARFLGVVSPHAAVSLFLSGGPGTANRVVLSYKTALTERGLASSTIARRLAALRSVVRLARTLGRIVWTVEIRSPMVQSYRDTRGPGDDGWTAMRKLLKDDTQAKTAKSYRDRAMLRVDHDLGLRVAELVGLDLEHVEFDAERPSAIWPLRKGRMEREHRTLAPPTGDALADWLWVRGLERGPLFVRLDRAADGPARITTKSTWRIVRDLGRRAGLDRDTSPHRLRHHAISAVLERNGGDVVAAQEFSGHRNLQTLCVYLDHLKDRAGEMTKLIADED